MRVDGEKLICEVCGKVCFTLREAGNFIAKCKRKKCMKKNNFIPKRSYYCKSCGYYHITHTFYIKNLEKELKERKNRGRHITFLKESRRKKN